MKIAMKMTPTKIDLLRHIGPIRVFQFIIKIIAYRRVPYIILEGSVLLHSSVEDE